MPEPPVWVRESDVAELISMRDAIEVLADGYRLAAKGAAASMRRAHLRDGQAILHAVGGSLTEQRVTGTKTWAYTPGGAAPLLILFSLDDGRVIGVVEAFVLGQLRTSATTGLGTRLLARADAHVLALLGTGRQAHEQARAIASVRPITSIRLFGRDQQRRDLMAASLQEGLGVAVTQFSEVGAAVERADIVTAVTRAAEPIVSADMLSPGIHINAVGAIVPSRRELDAGAVGRCACVVADSVEQARNDSGELRAAVDQGLLAWDGVRELSDVLDTPTGDLRSDTDITLFKSLGVGLSDIALGTEILRRAAEAGRGVTLPERLTSH